MCFRRGEDALACVRLSRDGGQIGITRVDGPVEPTATLIEGMAPQLKELRSTTYGFSRHAHRGVVAPSFTKNLFLRK